jgi:hypothetical protein
MLEVHILDCALESQLLDSLPRSVAHRPVLCTSTLEWRGVLAHLRYHARGKDVHLDVNLPL